MWPSSSNSPHRSELTHGSGQQLVAEWLRQSLGFRMTQPLNLWSLPDPPPGIRPVVPYKFLAALAIYGSPQGRLSLQDILSAIENRFPYYRNFPEQVGQDGRRAGKTWYRSIRHNLSLEGCFKSQVRPSHERGKGSYWYLTDRGMRSTQNYDTGTMDYSDEEDDD